ncbi:hypothetical protein BC940DRAFT_28418 [Gongronella butleri]|nr:hypothetical protein BC940DRAFT_28418 [Gongronella butleri]
MKGAPHCLVSPTPCPRFFLLSLLSFASSFAYFYFFFFFKRGFCLVSFLFGAYEVFFIFLPALSWCRAIFPRAPVKKRGWLRPLFAPVDDAVGPWWQITWPTSWVTLAPLSPFRFGWAIG